MSAPAHSRPFDLAAARAGAPFCGTAGEAIRVLIWDRKHPKYPILAIEEGGEQGAVAFSADGKAARGIPYIVDQLVMLPLGYIDGKPVFVGDEVEAAVGQTAGMIYTAAATWAGGFIPEKFRWPAPSKVYPETLMTPDDLERAIDISDQTVVGRCRSVANAALRHAVDAGQVVVVDWDAPARAARDTAIAQAAIEAAIGIIGIGHFIIPDSPSAFYAKEFIASIRRYVNLADVIAEVK